VAEVEGAKGGAQCLCQRPPSALSEVIEAKFERAKGGVEAQCICKRPPSALSQAIAAKVERAKGGVEAQCLCQRPSFAFSDGIPFETVRPGMQTRSLLWPPPG
jgi:hypothetical protein